jgi:hypothetical protein
MKDGNIKPPPRIMTMADLMKIVVEIMGLLEDKTVFDAHIVLEIAREMVDYGQKRKNTSGNMREK